MNKEEASKELEISVRSLQRLVENGKISVTHRRGKSGKQEAFFNPDEIADFKKTRDAETVKPATTPTNDTTLARIDVQEQFLEVLRRVTVPESKDISVAIADKPLLKVEEVMKLTGLSRELLMKAIHSSELKAKVIGRAYRVKRDDLNEYIEKL